MKRIVVDKLIEAFPQYADERLLALPDGWLRIVNELFCDLRDVQKSLPDHSPLDDHIAVVYIDWRFYPSDRHILYVRPALHHEIWTSDMSLRLIKAVGRFNEDADRVCEVCGKVSVGILKYQDHRRQERLCQAHMDERQWS